MSDIYIILEKKMFGKFPELIENPYKLTESSKSKIE